MRCGGIWSVMNMQHWMDDPDVRFVCQPSSPLRFTDAPAPALKPSPLLKQHEEEVLGGGFWVLAEEWAAFRESGASVWWSQ
jgi:crotonobetainyl-CoA:carnitine CoA-transferase CaiB-like acyl-CoA transferase